MGFRLVHTCPGTGARAGELITPHGAVPTPVFLPVGSQGTVKTLTPDELRTIGVRMLLANTYHLYLRPGMEVMAAAGGLHRFMAWDGAILTDSGGYQVFSLAPLRKVSEEGITFRSHIDGSEHFITPEIVVRFQETIGADVMMVLDECPPVSASEESVRTAVDRTTRWAERCLKTKRRPDQELYAIVQGGLFSELRRRSAEALTALDFPGYAIGGLSLGEPKQVTFSMVEETAAFLPEDRPRYLMGVGSPEDIVEGVARGCDMFDSALPTRVARNGAFLSRDGRRNIRNAVYRTVQQPLEPGCDCYTCRTFSAAYLHHLFSREELLVYRLTTVHNLSFMSRLMVQMRKAILDGTFSGFRAGFLAGYRTTDEQVRLNQKQRWLKTRGE